MLKHCSIEPKGFRAERDNFPPFRSIIFSKANTKLQCFGSGYYVAPRPRVGEGNGFPRIPKEKPAAIIIIRAAVHARRHRNVRVLTQFAVITISSRFYALHHSRRVSFSLSLRLSLASYGGYVRNWIFRATKMTKVSGVYNRAQPPTR